MIDARSLGRRLAGLALILVFLLTFHLEHLLVVHLALLVLGVAGLWLALANAAAVALTVGLLAATNSRLGSNDPIESWVYPALAVAGLLGFIAVMTRRFFIHMHETHEARWARRRRHRAAGDNDAESN
jgi:hypothetical protein